MLEALGRRVLAVQTQQYHSAVSAHRSISSLITSHEHRERKVLVRAERRSWLLTLTSVYNALHETGSSAIQNDEALAAQGLSLFISQLQNRSKFLELERLAQYRLNC